MSNLTQVSQLRDWPPTQYPCVIVREWACDCGEKHTSNFYSAESGDDDYDGFDFTCCCGAYYKKFCRVPRENLRAPPKWRSPNEELSNL